MRSSTRVSRLLTVGLLVALAGSAAAQPTYPNKPIRIISPFAPGGANTIMARIVGQKLTESWGQQVLVDNRPGGNTIVGSEALVRSSPDGYTIILTTNSHAINPNLLTVPYDAIKDFAPVATITSSRLALVLHPSVAANNLREFIALAKSRPEQINYASVGAGSNAHLAGELFNMVAGVKLQHVPYKGVGQILPDLMGGQVQMAFMNPSAAVAPIKSGQLKAIAMTGENRLSALPQVPTFTEAGLPGFDMINWYGFLAPAGTPKGIIDKLSTEFTRIMAKPDVKEKLASQGLEPFTSTPDQFAALLREEIAKYAKIIKIANIKL